LEALVSFARAHTVTARGFAPSSRAVLNMASAVPDSGKIKTFHTEAAFESWMRKHDAREGEARLRIYEKGSAVPSITIAEALDVVLCWDGSMASARPWRLKASAELMIPVPCATLPDHSFVQS
jgi:hypothetical protein